MGEGKDIRARLAPGCMMMICCHFYVTRVSYFNERACCAMRLVMDISKCVHVCLLAPLVTHYTSIGAQAQN